MNLSKIAACLFLFAVTPVIHAQPFKSCTDSAILRIGLISDPQYCDCDPSGSRIYREALRKLSEAIDTINANQVDFVMNLGDLTDRYYESYDTVSRIYQKLTMPFYNLLGNHEFEDLAEDLQATLLTRYGMPDYYYQVNYENWRFLVLDGTELAAYARSLHPEMASEGDSLFQLSQDSINNRLWNGGIGRVQRAWITDQIQQAFEERQRVILFCHFPIFPDSIYLNLWNDDEMVRLIEPHSNVIAFINGHYHPGNYGFRNGIHYVTHTAMLDTYESNSFSILNIFRNKLVFSGYGLNPDRVLPFHDPFAIPLNFNLSDSVLLSEHHAGSCIGEFSSNSEYEVTYSLGPDTGGYQNSLFRISHDSLFLDTSMDVAELDSVSILVTGTTCINDTATQGFKLRYDARLQQTPEISYPPGFSIRPNPANGVLYVTPEESSPYTLVNISIHDLSGRMINILPPVTNPFTATTEVRFSGKVRPGLYLMKLYLHPDKVVVGKIMVKN